MGGSSTSILRYGPDERLLAITVKNYVLTIALKLTPGNLPDGVAGTPYSHAITALGGTGTVTFAVTVGALPSGLTLNTNGTLTGTPTVTGDFTFTVTATDGATPPATGTKSYTLHIAEALTLSPATLPIGTVNVTYSKTINATGGSGTYTFAVTAGTLPGGLTLGPSDGTLTGTPTTAGDFTFTITATDTSTPAKNGSRPYTVTIFALGLSNLPDGVAGTPYSQAITATGGTGPYTFTKTGPLPTGLTLSADGVLSGTPTATGDFSFTVTATDTGTPQPATGSISYSVHIAPASLTLAPATLPDGVVGTAYSQVISASGGNGTYTFSATGTLPTSLTLSAGGTLSGTPSAAGDFTFTVNVHDSATVQATGSKQYTVHIDSGSSTGTRIRVTVNAPLPTDVSPGDVVIYTFTVTDTGDADATGVAVSYPLPATLQYITATGLSGGKCTVSGAIGAQTMNCTMGTIKKGKSETIALTVKVRTNTQTPTTIPTNTATATATNAATATGTNAQGVTVGNRPFGPLPFGPLPFGSLPFGSLPF